MSKFKNKVMVTGVGAVSSLGIGWQEFWKNLLAGKSGISKVEYVDCDQYDRKFAGEVKDFDPYQFIKPSKADTMGRASQFALAATTLALKDAGLDKSYFKTHRTSVSFGTTMGEPQIQEVCNIKYFPNNQKRFIDGKTALRYPTNSIATHVAQHLKIHGKVFMFSTACAAGNYALAYGANLIENKGYDCVIVGGSDALSRVAFSGFSRLFAMSPDLCRPFDQNRRGMQVGEGAGVMILESLESAQKRKAHIYAEVAGYGMSCDARHMTNPSEHGVSKAIKKALSNSGVRPDEVGYISAHGTGTPENDRTESQAIRHVFGKYTDQTPVSSIKSMLGHTMGAASALESIVCCLAIQEGYVPPTINHEANDPECPIDCVPNKSRKLNVKVALNNSQAFGGNNCVALFNGVKNEK